MAVPSFGIGDCAHVARSVTSREGERLFDFSNMDAFQTLDTCCNSVRKFVWSFCSASCYIASSKCNQGCCATFQTKHFRPEGKGELPYSIKPCHLILLFRCQCFGVTGRKIVGVFLPVGVLIAGYSPTTSSSQAETCLWVSSCCRDTPSRPLSSSPDSPDITVTPTGSTISLRGVQSISRPEEGGWMMVKV